MSLNLIKMGGTFTIVVNKIDKMDAYFHFHHVIWR